MVEDDDETRGSEATIIDPLDDGGYVGHLGVGYLDYGFLYLGRGGADDPLLNPMNNPNIRVADMM